MVLPEASPCHLFSGSGRQPLALVDLLSQLMPDIFISYSREDESRIINLVSELETHGWSVFWDRRIRRRDVAKLHRISIGECPLRDRSVVEVLDRVTVGCRGGG